MNLTRGINLHKIAELMPGASGAEAKVIFIMLLLVHLCLLGCVYRGWNVCFKGKASTRYSGRF